jgi:hypothetical protein
MVFATIAHVLKLLCGDGARPGTEALGPGLRRGDE